MKAKYVGRASDKPVRAFGTTFEPGKATEVPERYEGKVKDNPFFDAGGSSSARSTPAPAPAAPVGLKAEHRGGGSYAIMDGDKEVAKGLSKDDAETFNDMPDAEKAEYVKDKA